MLEVITSTLKRGDEVRLVGFGNFSVTRRKASTGRNPRTGEPMQIKATLAAQVPPGQGPEGRGSVGISEAPLGGWTGVRRSLNARSDPGMGA